MELNLLLSESYSNARFRVDSRRKYNFNFNSTFRVFVKKKAFQDYFNTKWRSKRNSDKLLNYVKATSNSTKLNQQLIFPQKGVILFLIFFNSIVRVIINYNSLKNIVYLVTEFAPTLAGIRVKQIFNKRTHHYEYGVRKHRPSLLKWIRVLTLKRVSSLISLFHMIHGVPPSSCLSFPSCFHVFCPSLVSFGMGLVYLSNIQAFSTVRQFRTYLQVFHSNTDALGKMC